MISRLRTLHETLMPHWTRNRTPDYGHFYRRCFTRRYRAKRRIVRDVWLGSGCVMLLNPVLPFMLALGLATTLLAFAILDETE
jgi:hypothetical protein